MIAQQARPVGQRLHLAEQTGSVAAEIGEQRRLHGVEPAGDALRGLLRSRQRARDDQRVARGMLRQLFTHLAAGCRKRGLLIVDGLTLGMTADVEIGMPR